MRWDCRVASFLAMTWRVARSSSPGRVCQTKPNVGWLGGLGKAGGTRADAAPRAKYAKRSQFAGGRIDANLCTERGLYVRVYAGRVAKTKPKESPQSPVDSCQRACGRPAGNANCQLGPNALRRHYERERACGVRPILVGGACIRPVILSDSEGSGPGMGMGVVFIRGPDASLRSA